MENNQQDNGSKLSQAISCWNEGDIGALISMFSDDIAYCSPLVGKESGSNWIQGIEEVAAHLLSLRKQFDRLEISDVLRGAGFTNLILRHATGCISLLIEPDEELRARRIIACHSTAVAHAG